MTQFSFESFIAQNKVISSCWLSGTSQNQIWPFRKKVLVLWIIQTLGQPALLRQCVAVC